MRYVRPQCSALLLLAAVTCGDPAEPCVPTCQQSCGGQPLSTFDQCPCGTVLHRVQSGIYSTESAQVTTDGCQLGLTPQSLSSPRKLTFDTARGTYTVSSEDGSEIIGTGAVICSSGVFDYGPAMGNDGVCTWTVQRQSQIRVSGDNRLELTIAERRSGFASVAGMSCPRLQPCDSSYSLVLSMPVR